MRRREGAGGVARWPDGNSVGSLALSRVLARIASVFSPVTPVRSGPQTLTVVCSGLFEGLLRRVTSALGGAATAREEKWAFVVAPIDFAPPQARLGAKFVKTGASCSSLSCASDPRASSSSLTCASTTKSTRNSSEWRGFDTHYRGRRRPSSRDSALRPAAPPSSNLSLASTTTTTTLA
jgi:hypothetical protein